MRLAIFLFPVLALAAQRVDLNTTETADFAAGGTIRIENSTGEMNVEGWDQPTVEIQVMRSVWSGDVDKAKAELEKIQVTKQLSGHELRITTVHKRFTGAQVNYRVRVPRNTNLVVHHGVGTVTVYDVAGDIEASARDGDLVVQLAEPAKYLIEARSRVGAIYSDFDSAHHPHLSPGERLNQSAEGNGAVHHIVLRTGVGGITIQKIDARPLLSLN